MAQRIGSGMRELVHASQYSADVLYETLCFNAQQAVEKALKAILVLQGVRVPFTHSIGMLISLIQESEIDWPEGLNPCVRLARYATHTRYPGPHDVVSEEDYQEAVRIAEEVVAWAERLVGERT